jgi:hypothetical protein
MNRFASASLLALVAVIAGCASPMDPRNDSGATTTDAATDAASSDRLEPDGARCVGGPQLADGPCRCQSDCALDATCSPEAESRAARGRCLAPCSPGSPAPEGFVCISIAGSARLFARCDAAVRCREGWACTQEGAPAHCTPLCTADTQCESGICDRATGLCALERTPPSGAEIGAACARAGDCRGDFCIPGSAGFSGGYCSGRCRVGASPCLDGGFCYLSAADRALGLEVGLCLKRCVSVDDCRAGYSCTPAGGASVCFR